MNRDDIRKLVGGYATGTLTQTERELLFDAALEDQELFEELAREQPLKELLELPGARARLIAATGPESPRAWWARPWPWAAMAAVAAGVVIAVVLMRTPERREIALVAPAPVAEVSEKDVPANQPQPPAPAPVERRLVPPPAAPAALRDKEAGKNEAPGVEPQTELKKEAAGAAAPEQRAAEREALAADSIQRLRPQAQQVQVQQAQNAAAPPPPAAKALARTALRLAFRYEVTGEVLRVIPAVDGFVRIDTSPARPVRQGVAVEFPVGDSPARVISFATSDTLGGISSGGLGQAMPPSGSVEFPADSPDRVTALIRVR